MATKRKSPAKSKPKAVTAAPTPEKVRAPIQPGYLDIQLSQQEMDALIMMLGLSQSMWENLAATATAQGADPLQHDILVARAKLCASFHDRLKKFHDIGEPESRLSH